MTVDELISHLDDANPAATSAQISCLEESLQVQLPVDYRSFLALRNGGSLDEQLAASFPSNRYVDGQGQAIVERVFSVEGRGDTVVGPVQRYLSEIEQSPEGIPALMICIADDFSGNVITLDLRPVSYGQIGLIDHELIGEKFDDSEGYQIIAPTFSAFVAKLENADAESPISIPKNEPRSLRWTGDNSEGMWVMLVGLVVAIIVLAWLG